MLISTKFSRENSLKIHRSSVHIPYRNLRANITELARHLRTRKLYISHFYLANKKIRRAEHVLGFYFYHSFSWHFSGSEMAEKIKVGKMSI